MADPTVVTVAMQKGGVGKSTTIINAARAATRLGLKVLVADLDPQGNTTDALTPTELSRKRVSIADAIVPLEFDDDRTPLPEVLVPTIWDGVDLAPVTNSDALTRVEMLIHASQDGREHRLSEALDGVRDQYDVVFIDNAPALGLLLGNALAASHRTLVVMEADRWSATGLVRLRSTIERAQRYHNPRLRWGGVLISKWRGTRDERDKLADIAAHFPQAEVWASAEDTSLCIPLKVAVKEHINGGTPLDLSDRADMRVLSETYGWVVQQLTGGGHCG